MNYRAIIQRVIETAQDNLNDWECDFMEKMNSLHIDKEIELSAGQREKILEINAKVLGRSK